MRRSSFPIGQKTRLHPLTSSFCLQCERLQSALIPGTNDSAGVTGIHTRSFWWRKGKSYHLELERDKIFKTCFFYGERVWWEGMEVEPVEVQAWTEKR